MASRIAQHTPSKLRLQGFRFCSSQKHRHRVAFFSSGYPATIGVPSERSLLPGLIEESSSPRRKLMPPRMIPKSQHLNRNRSSFPEFVADLASDAIGKKNK